MSLREAPPVPGCDVPTRASLDESTVWATGGLAGQPPRAQDYTVNESAVPLRTVYAYKVSLHSVSGGCPLPAGNHVEVPLSGEAESLTGVPLLVVIPTISVYKTESGIVGI